MKIEKTTLPIKCDFYGCKNHAQFAVSKSGFLKGELVFCEQCLQEMLKVYAEFSNVNQKNEEKTNQKRRRK